MDELTQVKTMKEDKVLVFGERLSALADGELAAGELAQLLASAGARDELQSTWDAYHLIGDVLRGGEQAAASGATGFVTRFHARLDAEGPIVPARPAPEPVAEAKPLRMRAEPANDANFRWKLVAGCASFAAVFAMAWGVLGSAGPGSAPQLASVEPAVQQAVAPAPAVAPQTVERPVTLADGEAQIMIRDARLDELLTAHKQAGGGTALQMPAGFLRSATFATPER